MMQKNSAEKIDSSGSTFKDKKAKVMMYVQQLKYISLPHLTEKLKNEQLDLLEKLAIKTNANSYALIIHDKDVNTDGTIKEPHVHMMLEFSKSVRLSTVANVLNDRTNYLQIYSRKGTNADAQNGYAYLIHLTNNARNKHQYSINDVRANFDFDAYIANLEFGVSKKEILNKLRDNQITAIEAKEAIAELFGADILAIYSNKIDTIDSYRSLNEYKKWRTIMKKEHKKKETIWLFGESGTGKSLIAEQISKTKNMAYFKTGGSNDLFQGYNGEHFLIIDELRPENILYSDLLKIIDPYNTDYLNYRMKTIERRHKSLTHATPHKLRHTGATLARQSGTSLEQISEALTHSDTNITMTYVNTPNVIKMPVGEIAYRKLSQSIVDRNGVNNGANSKKDASQTELRNV